MRGSRFFRDRIEDAIVREKRIKKWRREWKIDPIEAMNPDWNDLFDTRPSKKEAGSPRSRG